MNTRVAKWGNSLGVRLPSALAAGAGLKPGSAVDLIAEGNAIKIVPIAKIPRRLEAGYKEMAKDEAAEGRALEWSESLLPDAAGAADEAW